MYYTNEILIANKTARSKGSSVFDDNGNLRSVVANYVINNKEEKILDFGCGKAAVQANYLRNIGFDVDAYDFGDNVPEGGITEIKEIYTCTYASNVLNVSSTLGMLINTIEDIYNSIVPGGCAIMNYPSSPRKTNLKASDVQLIIESIFHAHPEKVGGTSSAPVWKICKPFMN